MKEEPIKIAILERLYKAVGICTVCGKHNCGHTGRVLPHILNRVDVLNAIDLEEKTLANKDKQ